MKFLFFLSALMASAGVMAEATMGGAIKKIAHTPENVEMIAENAVVSDDQLTTDDDRTSFAPLFDGNDNVVPNIVVKTKHGEVLSYQRPGADPCNPATGCTLDFALDKTVSELGWSQQVRDELEKIITTKPSEAFNLEYGKRLWMTSGTKSPKFYKMAITSWADGKAKTYPAIHWWMNHGEASYHVIKIDACGNWAGWKDGRLKVRITEGTLWRMPLGKLPIVSCVPDEQHAAK